MTKIRPKRTAIVKIRDDQEQMCDKTSRDLSIYFTSACLLSYDPMNIHECMNSYVSFAIPYIPAFISEHAMAIGVCPHMCGKASRDLKQRVDHFRGNVDPNIVLKWFSDLFSVSMIFLL